MFVCLMDSCRRENLKGQEDGWCIEAGWWWWGLEAGCGALISSVQMRTLHCLRDAALSQAKDSSSVVKGIMGGTVFRGCWDLNLFIDHFQICN